MYKYVYCVTFRERRDVWELRKRCGLLLLHRIFIYADEGQIVIIVNRIHRISEYTYRIQFADDMQLKIWLILDSHRFSAHSDNPFVSFIIHKYTLHTHARAHTHTQTHTQYIYTHRFAKNCGFSFVSNNSIVIMLCWYYLSRIIYNFRKLLRKVRSIGINRRDQADDLIFSY